MAHAMGLADITRETKTLPHRYTLSGYTSYTWTNGSTTVTASNSLKDSRKFYDIAFDRGVMIVPPSTATSFNSTSTGNDAWSEAVSITAAVNAIGTGTAKLNPYIDKGTYTMTVGDIYYSDGALSHQSDALLSGKTPIGVVGYIGNDYWTEKGVSGKGGHALVMCLKNIGSTGKTNAGTEYPWYLSNIDANLIKITDKNSLLNSQTNTNACGSGYTQTNTLVAKSTDYVAAYQAKNYKTLPANSNKCTGWFLPTAGQIYAIMSGLGGGLSNDWLGIYANNPSAMPNLGFFANMATVTGNINKALAKVGDANYTEFFGTINRPVNTSSEYSDKCAIGMDSGIDDGKGYGSIRFFGPSPKTDYLPIRPFLAF